MTNLYETLGVDHFATKEEIQKAYDRLASFYDPEKMASGTADPQMKIYFDEITLAFKTLANEESRIEYDGYIS